MTEYPKRPSVSLPPLGSEPLGRGPRSFALGILCRCSGSLRLRCYSALPICPVVDRTPALTTK